MINKVDLLDAQLLAQLKQELRERLSWDGEIYEISALSSAGCKALCEALMTSIETHRSMLLEDEEYCALQQENEAAMAFEIRRSIEATKSLKREDDVLFEDDMDDDWDE